MVAHPDAQAICGHLEPDVDALALVWQAAAGIPGVLEQVQQHLLDLQSIHFDTQVGRQGVVDRDRGRVREHAAEQGDGLVEQLPRRHRFAAGRALAGKGADAAQDARGALGLAGDLARGFAHRSLGQTLVVGAAHQAVGVVGDCRQWLVELVGERAGELAEHRQARHVLGLLLCAAHARFHCLARRERLAQRGGAALHEVLDAYRVGDPAHDQQREAGDPRPVAFGQHHQRGRAQVGIGADLEAAEEFVHRLVVGGHRPGQAILLVAHAEQRDRHHARELGRRVAQRGERPVGVERSRGGAREAVLDAG